MTAESRQPLYLISSCSEFPNLRVTEVLLKDAADEARYLAGRNPAHRDRQSAEHQLHLALETRIRDANKQITLMTDYLAARGHVLTLPDAAPEMKGTGDQANRMALINPHVTHDPFQAEVRRTNTQDEYQEIRVGILDGSGDLAADVLVSIDSTTGEPVVFLTTDGNGLGEHNVVVHPMRSPDEAVTVDRANRPQHTKPAGLAA